MKRLLVGVAFGLVVVSCGGGDGESDELAQAIGDQIWAEAEADIASGDVPFEFDQADADCLGTAFVDAIGYDNLVAAGVTAETVSDGTSADPFDELDLDAAAGEKVFEAMDGCIDFAQAMAEAGAAEFGIAEASAHCLFEGFLAQDAFRAAIVAGIVSDDSDFEDPFENADPEFVGTLFELMNDCLTDEELANLMGS